jgi:hypothetical protein
MDIKQPLIAIVVLLSSAACSVGGDYLPRDPGGMEMTDQERRGLLQAQIRDRRYGPGATSGNVDRYLNQLRNNKSIASMRSAINSMPGISEQDKAVILALPPAQQMSLMQELMKSELAPGVSTSSLTPQIFEKSDGTFAFGQLDNRGTGITFQDGTTYDVTKYPYMAGWKFVGNSMNLSPERRGDIAQSAARGQHRGATQGLLEQNTISKRCVSTSGLSTYDIELSLASRTGQIRYRFMGQDIFYDITIEEITDEFTKGVAVFESSRSGETRGNPFSFVYNFEKNTFVEGQISYGCSAI